MRQSFVSFGAGVLFAGGLGLSGMAQPAKIQAFLDFAGAWDPTLMGVMGAAVVTYFVAFRVIVGMPAPVLGLKFHIPTRKQLDAPLILGSALFGLGWGISGYCPGPAIVSLPTGSTDVLTFAISMLAGMGLFRVYEAWKTRRSSATASSPLSVPAANEPTVTRAAAPEERPFNPTGTPLPIP